MAEKFGEFKKEKLPAAEVEKEIPRPWEGIEMEEEEREIEKHGVQINPSKETRELIRDGSKSEFGLKKSKFLLDWFEKHQEKIEEEKGTSAFSEEMKMKVAVEKGAMKELAKSGEYQKEREKLEYLNFLNKTSERERFPMDDVFLMLNYLEKKAESKKEEINEIRDQGGTSAEIILREKESASIFNARRELAEKISGRDLRKEAETEAATKIEPREEYIGSLLSLRITEMEGDKKAEFFKEEYEALSDAEKLRYNNSSLRFAEGKIKEQTGIKMGGLLSERDVLALRQAGYKREMFRPAGFWGNKIELKKGEIMSQKEFAEFVGKQRMAFDKEIEEKAKKELGDDWEKQSQGLSKERLEGKITELALSPKNAAQGIEGMYKRAKEKIIADWAEKDLRKEKKMDKELEFIEKRFSEKGKNPKELFEDVLFRKGPLEKLTGNLKKDEKPLRYLFEKYGVSLRKGELEKKINPSVYQKEIRREKGFLDFIIDLFFDSLSDLAKAETKKAKRPGK